MLKLAAITNQPTLPHGLASRQKRNMRLRANGIEPVPGKDAGIKRRARYLSRVEATVTVKNPQQYLNAPMRWKGLEGRVTEDAELDLGDYRRVRAWRDDQDRKAYFLIIADDTDEAVCISAKDVRRLHRFMKQFKLENPK